MLWLAVLAVQPAAADGPARILAFGDSLTSGYGLDHDQAFPVQLERALKAEGLDIRVVNGGLSGDTTAGGLARLDWVLAAVPGGAPDAVILELGANDGLRGLDPDATHANLDRILEGLRERGIRVLLAGMLAPPNLGREYGDEFNSVFPRLAAEHGVALYPFFLDGVAGDPSLNQPDGLHPNADGVAEIVRRILPAVKVLVAEIH